MRLLVAIAAVLTATMLLLPTVSQAAALLG
jgi:hypothetical protein